MVSGIGTSTRREPGDALSDARARDAAAQADLGGLWRAVDGDTRPEKRTWFVALRELPTAQRVGFALLVSVLVAALMLVVAGGVRSDIATGSLVIRYALTMVGLVVLAGAAFAVALRGHHQRPLGNRGWAAWILVAAAIGVPVALALVPSFWTAADGPDVVVNGCLFIGLGTGLFAGIVAWLFQRATTPVLVRGLASAAAGGVIAFAMLQLHCPADDVEHLLIGHALVGIVLVVLAAVGIAARRRAR